MPDPSMLRVLRMVVGVAARQVGVDENVVDDVRLGATEAAAEAIAVHRGIPTDERVTVQFDFAPSALDVRVSHVVPDRHVRYEQGDMGDRMAVVAGIADEVDIDRDTGGCVTISMRWRQDDTRV
ncbi:MAG: ATP-binding protein [Actinomycetia bacterium]|nr:ATP-binding protein [Actinomycetes bacterium]